MEQWKHLGFDRCAAVRQPLTSAGLTVMRHALYPARVEVAALLGHIAMWHDVIMSASVMQSACIQTGSRCGDDHGDDNQSLQPC